MPKELLSKPKGNSFSVVLVEPEIPGNTGSIGRTCLALNLRLILIHPCAFALDEKSLRRAGLDYWKHVWLTEYQNWEEFLSTEKPKAKELIFFSKKAHQSYYFAPYQTGSYLIFGSETSGLPEQLLSTNSEQTFSLPIYSDKVRSLNLSAAATAACYEATRQLAL